MLARLYLATGLLACLALANPAPAEADDARVIIGVPSVEIHSPPVSIYFGPQPIYRPYYYYPPRHYHYRHPPYYHYEPRYYPRHYHQRPYGRPYHRDYYRNHGHRR
ncbi:hypothetical protein D9M71_463280 [compost metagenome]